MLKSSCLFVFYFFHSHKQQGYLELAEKGELICDNSVSPSPAATPRQSVSELEGSKKSGDENSDNAVLTDSISQCIQDVKSGCEEEKMNTRGFII